MTTDDFTFRLLDWAMAGAGAVLGLLWKSQNDKIKEIHEEHINAQKELDRQHSSLAEELSEIRLLVAGSYVKRDDLERLVTAIFAKLDKIENKLDGKADK